MKRRPRMIFKLALLVFAGAIINVAVAWGCSSTWQRKSNICVTHVSIHVSDNGSGFGVKAGFPFRALGGRVLIYQGQSGKLDYLWRVAGTSWADSTFLALRPLWPGFAINTIFYAAIVWMLFTVPGAVRRRVRIKRGQCASCGYSLRGTPHSERCPECGAAVQRAR